MNAVFCQHCCWQTSNCLHPALFLFSYSSWQVFLQGLDSFRPAGAFAPLEAFYFIFFIIFFYSHQDRRHSLLRASYYKMESEGLPAVPPLPPPPPPPPLPPPPPPPPPPSVKGAGLICRGLRRSSRMRNFNWETLPKHSVVGKYNIWTADRTDGEYELDTDHMEELFSHKQDQQQIKPLNRQSLRGQPAAPGGEMVSTCSPSEWRRRSYKSAFYPRFPSSAPKGAWTLQFSWNNSRGESVVVLRRCDCFSQHSSHFRVCNEAASLLGKPPTASVSRQAWSTLLYCSNRLPHWNNTSLQTYLLLKAAYQGKKKNPQLQTKIVRNVS